MHAPPFPPIYPLLQLFGVMCNDQLLEPPDPSRLPSHPTYGDHFKAAASSIFVKPVVTPLGTVGTRSQTVVAVRRDGTAEVRERYRSPKGEWQEVQYSFMVQLSGRLEGEQQAGQC